MTVPIGTFLQATVSFYPLTSGVQQNVWHFIVEGSAPPADALVMSAIETALTAFYSPFEAHWHTSMSDPILAVDVVEWNEIDLKWQVFYHLGDFVFTGLDGTLSDDILPAGTAGLVSFLPIYRNHEGKKFIGGFTEASNDIYGTPSNGLITALITAAAAIFGIDFTVETGISTLRYVLLDRKVGGFFYAPIAAIARNNWSYQRRRKQGVGA